MRITKVEVQIAIPDGDPFNTTEWVLRLMKDTAEMAFSPVVVVIGPPIVTERPDPVKPPMYYIAPEDNFWDDEFNWKGFVTIMLGEQHDSDRTESPDSGA